MRALLLYSHGSVLCGAEQNVLAMAERLRAKSGDAVEVAFLNYTAPDFVEAARRLHHQGAAEITIVPFFLVAGKFVAEELPKRIDEAHAQFPELRFLIADPIGFDERLADAVIDSAARATMPDAWRDTEEQAANFCRNSPKCPLHGTERCPETAMVAR